MVALQFGLESRLGEDALWTHCLPRDILPLDMPQRFFVASLQTPEHAERAYVGCASGDELVVPRTSAWFITTNPEEAFAFVSFDLAREFKDRLGKGEAYGLTNDGHIWEVVERP